MIRGIGNDIIEIARIVNAIKRHGQQFLDKVFTPDEQEYCLRFNNNHPHFAGRFAAKEAIAKALGTGFSQGLDWLDIEILPNNSGTPCVTLSQHINKKLHDPHLIVTISHSEHYATAVALWCNTTSEK